MAQPFIKKTPGEKVFDFFNIFALVVFSFTHSSRIAGGSNSGNLLLSFYAKFATLA